MGDSFAGEVLRSRVVVLEKLDGLNVGLDFSSSRRLRFWSRARGEVRPAQMGPSLWPLLDWAYLHLVELWALLGTKRELFGEWLGLPGSLPYPRRPDDFVALGLREGSRFVAFARARAEAERHGLTVPPQLARAVPRSTGHLEKLTRRSAWGGPAEGVVLEHAGRWLKWVRPDFGSSEPLWRNADSSSGGDLSAIRHRSAPVRRRHRRAVTKRFTSDRDADAALELAISKRGVGAGVLDVERSARGTRLLLEHVGAGPWPRRPTVELMTSLGRALQKLHRLRGILAPSLEPGPAAHARMASRRLSALLAAQEGALEHSPTVLCHGDLKPSNVRTDKNTAHLIDFERAFHSERAWELGAAADRLSLPRNTLPTFWKSVGVKSGAEIARAALYRLAWTLRLTQERRGSTSARKIAAALGQRARRMKRHLSER